MTNLASEGAKAPLVGVAFPQEDTPCDDADSGVDVPEGLKWFPTDELQARDVFSRLVPLSNSCYEVFAQVDKDHSGLIDEVELQQAFDLFKIDLTPRERINLFAFLDTKDAGELEYTEVRKIWNNIKMANEKDVEIDDFKYASNSCFCLSETNPCRQLFIRFMEWPWFERISMITIGCNCCTLALYNPLDEDCLLTKCKVITMMDTTWSMIFTVEMVVKMIGMGVWGEKAYTRDAWNNFDAFIVIIGLLDFVPGIEGGSLKAFRTFRVLRPLRALNKFPGLRVLIELIVELIPMLASVGALCCFIFLIYGILGVQLWQGMLRNRCYQATFNDTHSIVGAEAPLMGYMDGAPYICSLPANDGLNKCPDDYPYCLPNGLNPWYNAVSFDNIMAAFVAVFQVITLEAWVDVMYMCMDGFSPHSWVVFVSLIFIGAFFAINLTLVVVSAQFGETKAIQMSTMQFQAEEDLLMDKEREARAAVDEVDVGDKVDGGGDEQEAAPAEGSGGCCGCFGKSSKVEPDEKYQPSGDAGTVPESQIMLHGAETAPGSRPSSAKVTPVDGSSKPDSAPEDAAAAEGEAVAVWPPESPRWVVRCCQRPFFLFVTHHHFDNFIVGMIVLNTLMFAILHYPSSPAFDEFNDGMNVAFTFIFLGEFLAKLIGYGPKEYFCGSSIFFNWLDFVIVISSMMEVFGGGGGGVGVLKLLRLARMAKLLRYAPEIQKQIFVMVDTCKSVGNFLVLLMLFLFIYAIMGMQLFGGKFSFVLEDGTTEHYRKNFDDFLWANITVFQVLTGCDWTVPMRAAIRAYSFVASFYFVSLIMLGNYILFNLFVAILLEGFADTDGGEEDPNAEKESFSDMLKEIKEQMMLEEDLEDDIQAVELWRASVAQCENEFEAVLGAVLKQILIELNPMLLVHLRALRRELCDLMLAFKDALKDEIELLDIALSPKGGSKKPPAVVIRPLDLEPAVHNPLLNGDGYYPAIEKPKSKGEKSKAAGLNDRRDSHAEYMNAIDDLERTFSGELAAEEEAKEHSATADKYSTPYGDDQDCLDLDQIENSINEIESKKGSPTESKITIAPAEEVDDDYLASIETVVMETEQQYERDLDDLLGGDVMPDLVPTNSTGGSGSGSGNAIAPEDADSVSTPRVGTPRLSVESEQIEDPMNSERREGSGIGAMEGAGVGQGSHGLATPRDAEPLNAGALELNGLNGDSLGEKPKRLSDSEGNGDKLRKGSLSEVRATGRRRSIQPVALGEQAEGFEEMSGWERCTIGNKKSMWILPDDNGSTTLGKFRQWCRQTIVHQWFDRIVIILILGSSICLAWENPSIQDGSVTRVALEVSGFFFFIAFTIELGLKVLALGFWWGDDAYINNPWNKLDCFLVGTSWIDFILGNVGVSGGMLSLLRIFRMLRALRPLRMISRAPGLKLVVQTLMASMKPVSNTLGICLGFFAMFSILGMQLFMGKFFYCSVDDAYYADVETKAECEALEGASWVNQEYNFDHIGQGMMALFVLATLDGWVDYMYNGIDAVEIDKNPIRNYNEVMVAFYMLFLIMGGFMVLNMFIGVIVDTFQACAQLIRTAGKLQAEIGPVEVEEEEEEEEEEAPYHLEYNCARLWFFYQVEKPMFDNIINGVIMANVLSMCIEFWDQPDAYTLFLQILNYVFCVIFLYELIAKTMAWGWCRAFANHWYKFDFFIVGISGLGVLTDIIGGDWLPLNPTILRVLRIFRVARMLKVAKSMDGLRSLLSTVAKSLPQVGNLMILLFLVFFIFAALGVELFGKLDCPESNPCLGLDQKHANFKYFAMAMLTLFRIATGNAWSTIMKDALRVAPLCDDDEACTYNCCANPVLTPAYFAMFIVISAFMLLNIVIAVLMGNLDEAKEEMAAEEELRKGVMEEVCLKQKTEIYLELQSKKSGDVS